MIFIVLYSIAATVCISTAILDNRKKLRDMLKNISVSDNQDTIDPIFNKIHKGLAFDIFISMIPFVNIAVAINIVISKLFRD